MTENALLRRNLHNVEIVSWGLTYLPQVCSLLKVREYALGGSVAAYLYGIDPERPIHDIDVIVPKGTILWVKCMVKDSPFFVEGVSSSADAEFATNHYAIRTTTGYIVDFIETDDFSPIKSLCSVPVMPLGHLVKAKMMYSRDKDTHDEEKLVSLYHELCDKSKDVC